MTREEKYKLVDDLTAHLKTTDFFYITDASGMTVAQMNKFRKMCFDQGIQCKVVKNSLIKKALEKIAGDAYAPFNKSVLTGQSAILISPESGKTPAVLLQDYYKANKTKKPVFKGASIDSSLFMGADQLEVLTKLKSRQELIGEIVMLVQSPARRLAGAITSGGGRIAAMVKGIAEKGEE
jgi:large subunit ribosomal protein L10